MDTFPSYLLNLMFSLTSAEHSNDRYLIQDLYIEICDLAFRGASGTEHIKVKSLKAIIMLYEKYLDKSVNSMNEFHGCGAPYKVLVQLIIVN